jgi:hypothetical protein
VPAWASRRAHTRPAAHSSRIRPANDRDPSSNDGNHRAKNPQVRSTSSVIVAGSEIGPENTLKVETRVQIPLGLRRSEAISGGHEGKWPRIGPAAYTGPSRWPARFLLGARAGGSCRSLRRSRWRAWSSLPGQDRLLPRGLMIGGGRLAVVPTDVVDRSESPPLRSGALRASAPRGSGGRRLSS